MSKHLKPAPQAIAILLLAVAIIFSGCAMLGPASPADACKNAGGVVCEKNQACAGKVSFIQGLPQSRFCCSGSCVGVNASAKPPAATPTPRPTPTAGATPTPEPTATPTPEATPSPILQHCDDTDGGFNLGAKGVVSDPETSFVDMCVNATYVREYACTSTGVASVDAECASGEPCVEGACVAVASPTPTATSVPTATAAPTATAEPTPTPTAGPTSSEEPPPLPPE